MKRPFRQSFHLLCLVSQGIRCVDARTDDRIAKGMFHLTANHNGFRYYGPSPSTTAFDWSKHRRASVGCFRREQSVFALQLVGKHLRPTYDMVYPRWFVVKPYGRKLSFVSAHGPLDLPTARSEAQVPLQQCCVNGKDRWGRPLKGNTPGKVGSLKAYRKLLPSVWPATRLQRNQ